MRANRDGMNAGVGAPGAEHLRILGGEAVDRFLDRLLDAGAVRLPLPAHKGAAVIFDGEGEAGHGGPLSRSCRAKSRHPEGVDYRWASRLRSMRTGLDRKSTRLNSSN